MAEYRNLLAEKARNKVTNQMIAEVVGKSIETIEKKMAGHIAWRINEALAIRDAFFPNCTLDYLFEPFEDVS